MDGKDGSQPREIRMLADRATGKVVCMKVVTRPSRSSRSRHRAIFVVVVPGTNRATLLADIRLEQN